MRLLSSVLAFVLFAAIGCSENLPSGVTEGPLSVWTQGQATIAAKVTPADITVFASGDITGVTDADAIENALSAASPGDIVELSEGVFYVNRTLVASGFSGTLRGVGSEVTLLRGVGSVATPFGNAVINLPEAPFPLPGSAMIFFSLPCDLEVSDLSVELVDGFATEDGPVTGDNMTSFFTVQLGTDDCNTTFHGVALRGTAATPASWPGLVHQPFWGVAVLGDGTSFPSFTTGGKHVLSHSILERIGIQSAVYELFKDADVTISRNTLRDQKQINVRYLDHSNVLIEHNDIQGFSFGSVVVTQEWNLIPGEPSNVHILQNTIHTDGFLGIESNGFPNDPSQAGFNLLVEKNTITKSDDPLGLFSNLAGIGIIFTDGDMVRSNIVRGVGDFSVLLDGDRSTLIGNNTEGFGSVVADFGIFGDDNTVVGVGTSTVVDAGTGNLLTGLTKVPGESVGERLKEAHETRKAILDAIGSTYGQ